MSLRLFINLWLTLNSRVQWVIGQTISAGVLRGLLHRTDQWGWRIPYATQWIWPAPIIVGVLFAPEVCQPKRKARLISLKHG